MALECLSLIWASIKSFHKQHSFAHILYFCWGEIVFCTILLHCQYNWIAKGLLEFGRIFPLQEKHFLLRYFLEGDLVTSLCSWVFTCLPNYKPCRRAFLLHPAERSHFPWWVEDNVQMGRIGWKLFYAAWTFLTHFLPSAWELKKVVEVEHFPPTLSSEWIFLLKSFWNKLTMIWKLFLTQLGTDTFSSLTRSQLTF